MRWSTRQLSVGGNMVMLLSVLAAMPSFSMICFNLPKRSTKRIQSVFTLLWCDAKHEKKKMCWISWSNLTQSRKDRGLEFRDIELFNGSLLGNKDGTYSKYQIAYWLKYSFENIANMTHSLMSHLTTTAHMTGEVYYAVKIFCWKIHQGLSAMAKTQSCCMTHGAQRKRKFNQSALQN